MNTSCEFVSHLLILSGTPDLGMVPPTFREQKSPEVPPQTGLGVCVLCDLGILLGSAAGVNSFPLLDFDVSPVKKSDDLSSLFP